MTDRELLEMAAKAAGIDLVPYTWDKHSPWGEHQGFTVRYEGAIEWNPLEDDGDALRLAVKLNFKVSMTGGEHAEVFDEEDRLLGFMHHHADPCAATRRAIVRAAAEIGRAK